MTSADLAEPGAVVTPRVDLVFVTSGSKVRVPAGVTVFDAASWNGIAIDSTCGGHGTCKKCKVRIAGGSVPASSLDARAFTPDELRDGWRLACRAAATADLQIEVPPLTTRPKAATVGVGRQVILRPAVQKRHLELDEPSLSDQRSDIERVLDGLDDLEPRVDLPVLRSVGRVLRAADYKVTAVVVDEVLIDVQPGDTTGSRYGIAFDLGTTTVVATLLDLSTGTPMAVASMLSKQQPFGADVISRISAVMMEPANLDRLTALAHSSLGDLVGEVCDAADVDPLDVYEVALAGNATMTHLALGIRDWLLATAAPAGPAFEGAAMRCGMRAADGAIEGVALDPAPAGQAGSAGGVSLKIIGDCAPEGLCGSGLVDAVASRIAAGLLDHSGRFVPDEVAARVAPGLAARLTMLGEERVFVLHWRREPGDVAGSIFLTQRDVRELQFAKAAIASGWNVLLEEARLTPADVQQVLLAGSFGSYLSPASAIKLGLVPKLPALRVVSAGNVAGEGAKMALLSVRERAAALALLEEVRYVELSDRADFNDRFVEQLQFPR